MALEGGCRWIQLRMKDASDDEVREAAAEIQPMCKAHDAIFLLDDRVELAKELKADGVHLGKNDMPVDEARRVLGEEFIIGGTANTFDDMPWAMVCSLRLTVPPAVFFMVCFNVIEAPISP